MQTQTCPNDRLSKNVVVQEHADAAGECTAFNKLTLREHQGDDRTVTTEGQAQSPRRCRQRKNSGQVRAECLGEAWEKRANPGHRGRYSKQTNTNSLSRSVRSAPPTRWAMTRQTHIRTMPRTIVALYPDNRFSSVVGPPAPPAPPLPRSPAHLRPPAVRILLLQLQFTPEALRRPALTRLGSAHNQRREATLTPRFAPP